MRHAAVVINEEELFFLLRFPHDAVLLDCEWDARARRLIVRVDHKTAPDCPPGGEIEWVPGRVSFAREE